MNLRSQVVMSVFAIFLAQGSCLSSAIEGITGSKEARTETVETTILGETQATEPEPTIDFEEWHSVSVGGAVDPVGVNQGTHNYEGVEYNNTCTCLPTEILTRTFEFSEDSVTDGIHVYTRTGENSYVYNLPGYRIERDENGVESRIETENYYELVFTDTGYFMNNFTDVMPGEGDPCCYYQFFQLDD